MDTKVTEITIQQVQPRNGLVAIATFVLDEKVYVGSIGVYMKDGGGYRLSYPTKKVGMNRYNIFKPINRETQEAIEAAVLGEYDNLLTEGVTMIDDNEG